MRTSLLLLALLIPAGAPAQPAAPTWPGFRGPLRDGVAKDAAPPTTWSDKANVAWRVPLPGPGSSSPIVVGDRVFVTCYSGYGQHLKDGGDKADLVHHLVCVQRDSGAVVWSKSVPGPLPAKARQVQITEHGFASPTPASDGETVYAYFGRAGVVAFDRDGAIRWRTDLGKPSADAPTATNAVEQRGQVISLRWGSAASPVLCGGLVIVNCSEESNSIRALDCKTGELRWKRESANLEGCATTPAIAGRPGEEVLVMVLGGEVWGLDPATGESLWSVETGTRGGMSPTPVADRELAYTSGGSGKSFAIRFAREIGKGEDGAPLTRVAWQSENQDIPSPVLHEGRLFMVRQDGTVACLDAKDGSELFSGRLDGRTGMVYASPVVAGGHLYVVSRKRGTFVYAADEKLKLVAKNELADDSQFNGSPAVAGDTLWLRSDAALYCIRKPAAEAK